MSSNESGGFSLERLKTLEIAIAEGVRRVKYSDKEIEYRSLKEMLEAREIMRKALGLKSSCGEPGLFGGKRITAKHSKGLDDN